MSWNARLTHAREASGLSKTKLAILVGVSSPTVTDWESGEIANISGENLLAVCDAVRATPHWLLRGEGRPPEGAVEQHHVPSGLNVGDRIRTARKAANISQLDLSIMMERAQSAINRWENNTCVPEFETLVPLAQALGVTLDWLMGRDVSSIALVRAHLEKKSGMQVVSQLSGAILEGAMSAVQLHLLSELITQFAGVHQSSTSPQQDSNAPK